MSEYTRRGFLGGLIATLAGTGILAGTSAGVANADTSSAASGDGWDDEADVVVIGCGTGLGAVLSASQAGASVIALEKCSTVGGNWAINQGVFFAPATDAMTENGDTDSRTGKTDTLDGAFQDWLDASSGICNQELVKVILGEQQKFINSLVAEGYKFETMIPGVAPVARGHSILNEDGSLQGGSGYVDALKSRVDETDAKILTDTVAKKIILDDGGKAIGVEAMSNGKTILIGAKAIVVATGGYTANLNMRAIYSPETDGWGVIGGSWATGDGHRMLFEHDAAIPGHNVIKPTVTVEKFTGAIYATNEYSVFWTTPRSLFITDSEGKRNRDETESYVTVDSALLTSPNYQIFDQALFDEDDFTLTTTWSKDLLQQAVDDGYLVKADTVAELAAGLYLDETTLQQTIDDFNEAANSGSDPYGRPAETMRALEPPYYGSTGTDGIAGTSLMCVSIDDQARVLTCYGDYIPGVYGAGNDMVFYNYAGPNYIASGAGCASGYAISTYAGRNAAEYAAAL